LIGAREDEIFITSYMHTALAAVATLVGASSRPGIVMGNLDVPAIGGFWYEQNNDHCSVVYSTDQRTIIPAALAELISDQTALVVMSHVFPASGFVADIAQVAAFAHEKRSPLLIDASLSVGCLPLHVDTLRADFLVATAERWLLGGSKLTFLYVRKGPLWQAVTNAARMLGLCMEPPTTQSFRVIKAYLDAVAPSLSDLLRVSRGLEVVLQVGDDARWQVTSQLIEHLCQGIEAAGYPVLAPGDTGQRSGLVLIPTHCAELVAGQLTSSSVFVGIHPRALCLAPAFFNTEDDIDRAISALKHVPLERFFT
jgi:selenocysteine lyase/cysteine desulfurase